MDDEKKLTTYKVLAELASLINRDDLTNMERRGVNQAWWTMLEMTDVKVLHHGESTESSVTRTTTKPTIGFHP